MGIAGGLWRVKPEPFCLFLGAAAVAPVSDPASSRQAGRSPNGSTVSRRVPRCGAAAAGTRSKSSLKGGHGSRRRAFERADVCLPRPKARAKCWSLRANGHRNSHCAPTPSGTISLLKSTVNTRRPPAVCATSAVSGCLSGSNSGSEGV